MTDRWGHLREWGVESQLGLQVYETRTAMMLTVRSWSCLIHSTLEGLAHPSAAQTRRIFSVNSAVIILFFFSFKQTPPKLEQRAGLPHLSAFTLQGDRKTNLQPCGEAHWPMTQHTVPVSVSTSVMGYKRWNKAPRTCSDAWKEHEWGGKHLYPN